MPVNELEIFEIELPNTDGAMGNTSVGLTVDETTNPPTIELFTLQENQGPSPIDNIFKVIPAIRDKYFPDLQVQDINWRLTNNWQRVGMSFQEMEGVVIRADFPNGILQWTPWFLLKILEIIFLLKMD